MKKYLNSIMEILLQCVILLRKRIRGNLGQKISDLSSKYFSIPAGDRLFFDRPCRQLHSLATESGDGCGLVLAIDTSSPITSVALGRGGKTVVCIESESQDSHNEILSSMTGEVLKKGGCRYQDLSLLLLGAGPGSFTGLRIGFAFVKGVSVALGVPIVQISSLKAYAASCQADGNLIVSLGDARRGEFFCSIYLDQEGELLPLLEDQILSGSEVEKQAAMIKKERQIDDSRVLVVFAGNELPYKFNNQIKRPLKIAEGLCRLLQGETGYAGDLEKYRDFQSAEVMPNYVRRVAASTIAERLEEKRLKNQ